LGEDPAQTHVPNGRIFCITGMAVRRAHWRRGYGTALLERLLAIAQEQGCEQVVLETTHAVGLYARHGFVVTGQRTQRDVTLTVMARALG
jgi:N-acetylglutamate synthase-like GNAT family acetyltransferase